MIHRPKTLTYGGAVLTTAVLILAAPRAAHALAATLVQVVNTTTSPVPNLDTDTAPAMIRYLKNCAVTNCPAKVHE